MCYKEILFNAMIFRKYILWARPKILFNAMIFRKYIPLWARPKITFHAMIFRKYIPLWARPPWGPWHISRTHRKGLYENDDDDLTLCHCRVHCSYLS